MAYSGKKNRETINSIKNIFDKHGVNRLNIEDEFFVDLINSIQESSAELNFDDVEKEQTKQYLNITDVKMELMVNIEGIINEMKGKTRLKRYSFGLDIKKAQTTVFLTELKVLYREKQFKRSDFIVFYDDTSLRTGNRGFAITRDEFITNTSGIFRRFKFSDMEEQPEFVEGLKRDAFRLHLDNTSYDIKFRKNIANTSIVYDVIKLLYKYAVEMGNENEKTV